MDHLDGPFKWSNEQPLRGVSQPLTRFRERRHWVWFGLGPVVLKANRMFKKAVEAKSHQRLSGADRKKLRRTVQNKFCLLTDELLDAILPPKVEITVSKFQNRVLVYSIEGGCPMFFDIDGRGNEILPTVFALWEAPEMLPSFVLKGGEVSRYVLGGADLMFPGILIPAQGFPSFAAGEIWSVIVPGNPAPIHECELHVIR